MDIFEKAVMLALKAHEGQERKNGHIPFFLHPAEAAAIAATITSDREVLAAVILHDTLEDTALTIDEIRSETNDRVAYLVESETEESCKGMPRSESWRYRKESSLEKLAKCNDVAVKIMWLSDKLANMRAFYRQYLELGTSMWQNYNHSDIGDQAWYYRTVAKNISELADTQAYKEYMSLLNIIFSEVD